VFDITGQIRDSLQVIACGDNFDNGRPFEHELTVSVIRPDAATVCQCGAREVTRDDVG
jgi:hypothetical protein